MILFRYDYHNGEPFARQGYKWLVKVWNSNTEAVSEPNRGRPAFIRPCKTDYEKDVVVENAEAQPRYELVEVFDLST